MGRWLNLALTQVSTWGVGHSGRSKQLPPALAVVGLGWTLHTLDLSERRYPRPSPACRGRR